MIKPAFEIAPRPLVPLTGKTTGFPVNRIFCVGRNYAAHAREMGADPEREPPFFFQKPADTLLAGTDVQLPYPPSTSELHHEVEFVVGLHRDGRNLSREKALDHVFGAALGIDFTRRDLQADAKAAGRPWDMGKGFDGCAVTGPMTCFSADGLPASGHIELEVNGVRVQQADLKEMIWPVADTIAILSSYLTLRAGDLIFTGTPEGVGPVRPGDTLLASGDHLEPFAVTIVPTG